MGAFILGAGGTITGGEQDYVSAGGAVSPQPSVDTILSGTLTTAANGLGTLTLVTNNSTVGAAGTETFSLAEVNSKHAVIGEFDSGATSSGSLDFQTLASSTLAEVNGPFVFSVSGKSSSKAEVFGGLMTSDGAGHLTTADVDQNSGGAVTRGGSNAGTYTAPDAAGRGSMTFGGNHYSYYVVNAKVLRLVIVDASEPTIGTAYTGVSGITNANLTNSFLFADSSNLSAGASFAAAGKLTLDAGGHVTGGFTDVNENGTATSAAVTG
ncbi:MAG TPA: hypothetical protein VH161_09175, partial [Candidatus Acidoferrales bacterium]|nr:hypothetical protein [Candidatus Acidoferrales bacterium]